MYLSRRFYLFILVIILLLCGGYMLGTLFLLGQIALAVLILRLRWIFSSLSHEGNQEFPAMFFPFLEWR